MTGWRSGTAAGALLAVLALGTWFAPSVERQAVAVEPAAVPTYDFGRSFLRWTSTKNNHTPRLQVDAACTVTRDGKSREFFLSAMCTGETMYADKDLIHDPAYEFAMIYSPPDQFMFFKWFADPKLNVVEVRRVGETMSTQDGRGSPIVDMTVRMVRPQRVRPLTTYAEIREAILGDQRLNGRTEYLGEDGKTTVVLNYPIKICNIAHGRDRWQVDTGVLLPDLAVKAELPIAALRMGYLVFNTSEWAEVILRKPGTKEAGKSAFTERRRINVKNQIVSIDAQR